MNVNRPGPSEAEIVKLRDAALAIFEPLAIAEHWRKKFVSIGTPDPEHLMMTILAKAAEIAGRSARFRELHKGFDTSVFAEGVIRYGVKLQHTPCRAFGCSQGWGVIAARLFHADLHRALMPGGEVDHLANLELGMAKAEAPERWLSFAGQLAGHPGLCGHYLEKWWEFSSDPPRPLSELENDIRQEAAAAILLAKERGNALPPPCTDILDKATVAALKGNQKTLAEELNRTGGCVPIEDFAELVSWHPPYDDAASGLVTRFNKKLKSLKNPTKIMRFDNCFVRKQETA